MGECKSNSKSISSGTGTSTVEARLVIEGPATESNPHPKVQERATHCCRPLQKSIEVVVKEVQALLHHPAKSVGSLSSSELRPKMSALLLKERSRYLVTPRDFRFLRSCLAFSISSKAVTRSGMDRKSERTWCGAHLGN